MPKATHSAFKCFVFRAPVRANIRRRLYGDEDATGADTGSASPGQDSRQNDHLKVSNASYCLELNCISIKLFSDCIVSNSIGPPLSELMQGVPI